MNYIAYLMVLPVLSACTSTQSQDKTANATDFNAYWYAGEAEITGYKLQQARYGEIHSGEAVLVFVTEPFSESKQVKPDNWNNVSSDHISVLKLNMTKKFLTGIYPYSMMLSTFKPVVYDKYPDPLKITTSSQDWCGHTFMQMNLNGDRYRLRRFSYFESINDVDTTIPNVLLEDELWTALRLNPDGLPVGKIELIPSAFYLRLHNREVKPQKAKASLVIVESSDFSKTTHRKYALAYHDRSLAIYFEASFPYAILGWEESHLSGFDKPERLTTTATRINRIKSPYWSKNSVADRKIRKELGLSVE